MTKPRLLIIGGGFAGVSLALNAAPYSEVVLVSRVDYFELTWATVRSIVDAKTADRTVWNLTQMQLGATIKQGTVVSMTDKTATLDSGEVINFDYVALCHGSAYSDGFGKSKRAVTREERLQELQSIHDDIARAKNIVVVGGGPSGTEVAAEIVEAYAGKQVTLVTPQGLLLEGAPAKVSTYTRKWLEAHKVQVVTGARVSVAEGADRSHPGSVSLSTGQQLPADLAIWCTGFTVNSDFLKPSLSEVVDSKGRVQVNEFLQVKGHPHMFALGDCNDFPEPSKKAYLAFEQGKLIASSLRVLIAGKPGGLQKYKPMDALFVSLGRGDGAGHVGSCTCTGWFVKTAKSKGMFIDRFRSELKVKG